MLRIPTISQGCRPDLFCSACHKRYPVSSCRQRVQYRGGGFMSEKVSLAQKFSLFREQWQPKIVARVNDYDVMVVRVEGEFVWHSHAETDDFFFVVEGELDIELRDRTVSLTAGELFVVPKGVEHRPVARKGEVKLLLIEPQDTPNTGDRRTAVTKVEL